MFQIKRWQALMDVAIRAPRADAGTVEYVSFLLGQNCLALFSGEGVTAYVDYDLEQDEGDVALRVNYAALGPKPALSLPRERLTAALCFLFGITDPAQVIVPDAMRQYLPPKALTEKPARLLAFIRTGKTPNLKGQGGPGGEVLASEEDKDKG
jgi:hypothetical protein